MSFKIVSTLFTIDRIASYIPVVSTVTSIIHLLARAIMKVLGESCEVSPSNLKRVCSKFLNGRATYRYIALIPVLGNGVVIVLDWLRDNRLRKREAEEPTTEKKSATHPIGIQQKIVQKSSDQDSSDEGDSIDEVDPLKKSGKIEEEIPVINKDLFLQRIDYYRAVLGRADGTETKEYAETMNKYIAKCREDAREICGVEFAPRFLAPDVEPSFSAYIPLWQETLKEIREAVSAL